MNLNQVTLPAIDIAQSVDFYTRPGFTQIVDSAHYARIKDPSGNLICLYRAGKNRRYPPWRIESG